MGAAQQEVTCGGGLEFRVGAARVAQAERRGAFFDSPCYKAVVNVSYGCLHLTELHQQLPTGSRIIVHLLQLAAAGRKIPRNTLLWSSL
jgi:hypothetical protein